MRIPRLSLEVLSFILGDNFVSGDFALCLIGRLLQLKPIQFFEEKVLIELAV